MNKIFFSIITLLIININITYGQSLVLAKFLNASGGLYSSPTNVNGYFIKSSIGQVAVEKKIGSQNSDFVLYNGYWSKIRSAPKTAVNFENLPEYKKINNSPNPFSNTTNINYELVGVSKVELVVYDISGNEIAQLVNDVQEKGHYSIEFNASKSNLILSSGNYFYELRVSPIAIGEQYFELYNIRNIMVLVK